MESRWLILVITLAVVGIAAVMLVMRSKRLREKEFVAWVDAYRATTAQPETDPSRLRELWMTDLRSSAQARTVAGSTQHYAPVAVAGDTSAAQYPLPAVVPRTNIFAILALVFGLMGWLGLVFGHIALVQIRAKGEGGRGLAMTGLVFGYAWLAFAISMLVISYTMSLQR